MRVHAEGCWWMPKPENRRDLDECANGIDAVAKARELFADADGCAHCCTEQNMEPADREHTGR